MTSSAPGQPAAPAGVPSGTGDRVRAEITWAIRMGRKAVAEQTHYAARLSATARAALDDLDTRLAAGGYLTLPAEVMPVGHAIETACTRLRARPRQPRHRPAPGHRLRHHVRSPRRAGRSPAAHHPPAPGRLRRSSSSPPRGWAAACKYTDCKVIEAARPAEAVDAIARAATRALTT